MTQPGPSDVHEDRMMGGKRKRKRKRKMMVDVDVDMMDMAKLIDSYIDKKSKFKSPEKERPSLKWPHLYDILRDKGYDKEKAARISNSRRGRRNKGRLSTAAGRRAAKERRAAKMGKSIELVNEYLSEIDKVSTKAGMGYTHRRKKKRKSVGMRSVRHRRLGRARPLPRRAKGGQRAEAPTARGRHGRS